MMAAMKRDTLAMSPSTLLPELYSLTPEQYDEYLAACYRAGFTGISLWTLHHMMLTGAGMSTEEIKARLLAHEQDVVMVEAIFDWGNAESADQAVANVLPSIEIAASYGSPLLAAVVLEPELNSLSQCIANLQAVADVADQHDVSIAIEYLPWTAISDIGVVWDLISRTARTNVGILFDSWHWQRQEGGPDAHAETLLSIPGEKIFAFQICDAQPEPAPGLSQMDEAMSLRPLPGDGVVDHARLFELFNEIGADPIVVPEVFNTELNAQGMEAMAQAVFAASQTAVANW